MSHRNDRLIAALCCIWWLTAVALVSGQDAPDLQSIRRAVEQGDAEAMFSLGSMYCYGRGVPQDYVAAHMWANLAGAQGLKTGRELRDSLAERMSAGQIAEAQRAAREWRRARQ